jgi:hypothetical protein
MTVWWDKCVSLSFAEIGRYFEPIGSRFCQILQWPSFLVSEGSAGGLTAARGAVCDDQHSACKPPVARRAQAKACFRVPRRSVMARSRLRIFCAAPSHPKWKRRSQNGDGGLSVAICAVTTNTSAVRAGCLSWYVFLKKEMAKGRLPVALRFHGRQVLSLQGTGVVPPGWAAPRIANVRANYPALCRLSGRSTPRGGRPVQPGSVRYRYGAHGSIVVVAVRTAESLLTFTRAGAPTRLRV